MQKIINTWKEFYYNNLLYLSIFTFYFVLFALSNSGVDSSEGLFHYQVALQIIKHGQLGFDTPQDGIFQLAPNGRTYAGHEIGNTLFMLPTALINVLLERVLSQLVSSENLDKAQQFILSFQASFYSSITATLFFAILKVGFSKGTIPSFIATLCLSLTTFFWTYSRNLFDGVLCSTLLIFSLFLLLRYRQTNNLWILVSCFICLGFGLITRLSMILPIVVSIAYLVSFNKVSIAIRFKQVVLAIFTLIPFFIWQCWYNYLRTGIFYKSPVQTTVYSVNNALDGNIFLGITGLLFSPGKSIFIYAPLLILAVILWNKFYQDHQKEGIYVLALSVMWLLLHARLRSWYGAAGWGPRHFISILPVMFLPFAVNIEYVWKKTQLRISAIVLATFGFILALSSIISNWHFRMMYAHERGVLQDDIFIWGLSNSQPVDMVKGAFGNIIRIVTHTPIITIKDTYSEANEYASSTINIWYNSLLYAGIHWYIVILLLAPLLTLMYISVRNILQKQH